MLKVILTLILEAGIAIGWWSNKDHDGLAMLGAFAGLCVAAFFILMLYAIWS